MDGFGITTVSVTIWPLTVMTRLLVSGGGVLDVVVASVLEDDGD